MECRFSQVFTNTSHCPPTCNSGSCQSWRSAHTQSTRCAALTAYTTHLAKRHLGLVLRPLLKAEAGVLCARVCAHFVRVCVCVCGGGAEGSAAGLPRVPSLWFVLLCLRGVCWGPAPPSVTVPAAPPPSRTLVVEAVHSTHLEVLAGDVVEAHSHVAVPAGLPHCKHGWYKSHSAD